MDGGNYGKIRINSTLKKYKRCTEFLLCYISLCFYVSRHSAQQHVYFVSITVTLTMGF